MKRRTFLGSLAAAGVAAANFSGCASPSNSSSGGSSTTRRGDGGPVIDIHAHWHAPDFVDLLAKEAGANGAKAGRSDKGYVTFFAPGLGSVFQPQYINSWTLKKNNRQGNLEFNVTNHPSLIYRVANSTIDHRSLMLILRSLAAVLVLLAIYIVL